MQKQCSLSMLFEFLETKAAPQQRIVRHLGHRYIKNIFRDVPDEKPSQAIKLKLNLSIKTFASQLLFSFSFLKLDSHFYK
jgi:EAL domain-containing protein (putative c-di-GMP-specific phosphodiesterase class I)